MAVATRVIQNRVSTKSKPRRTYSQQEFNVRTAGREKRKSIAASTNKQRELRVLSSKITQENEQFRTGQAKIRRVQAREQITERYREGIGIRRSERMQRQLIEEPVVGAVKPISNSVILVVVMIFMLLIFYTIVTHSEGFSGFLEGVGNVIATFSQTAPLFTKSQT